MLKRILVGITFLLCLISCDGGSKERGGYADNPSCDVRGKNDIVILFTNDVHCGVDEKIGYAGLAAYKDSIKTITPNVILADVGDAVQGSPLGTLSKGGYIIGLMNDVGYDVAVVGNHEFDYGMDQFFQNLYSVDMGYVISNFAYTGNTPRCLIKINTYKIIETTVAGRTVKVGFVGAVTPLSYTSSSPKTFKEDGKIVYDLYDGENGKRLVNVLQQSIDSAKNAGADYIVLLAHLGVSEASAPYRSVDVIHGLTGVDVVLDGHSHSVIPHDTILDVNGKVVLLASTGSKLENIGQMVISKNGSVCTKLVHDYASKNANVKFFIEMRKARLKKILKKVVARSPVEIFAFDENLLSLARVMENGIGNLIADAFKYYMKADIGFVNGGNVRANIPEGSVTYGDFLDISPFGNKLVLSKVRGSVLQDALEYSYRMMTVGKDGKQVVSAEVATGGFLQVSGLKVVVNGKIKSGVKRDSKGMFVGVEGARKVVKVLVEKNGKYVPLDTSAEYRVASLNFILEDAGDGYSMFKNSEIVDRSDLTDAEVVVEYLKKEHWGRIPERYAKPEGRIRLK